MEPEIRPITGNEIAPFVPMAPRVLASELAALSPQSDLLTVGAWVNGRPVGLAVGRKGIRSEIVSLFVRPELWKQGLGTALFTVLEEQLARCGTTQIHLRYTTEMPAHYAVERILARRGWPPPRCRWIIGQFDSALLERAAWSQGAALPSHLEFFPWAELSPAEHAALGAVQTEVPAALWPFTDPMPVDAPTSVGLRAGSEIVGWMITNRVSPTVIRFAMLYVRARWRTPQRSFALLAEAGRCMRAHYGPEMRASAAVQIENAPMLRVLERKFRPGATLWAEMRSAERPVA